MLLVENTPETLCLVSVKWLNLSYLEAEVHCLTALYPRRRKIFDDEQQKPSGQTAESQDNRAAPSVDSCWLQSVPAIAVRP